MKGNYHRKLFSPDYFGWHYYCFSSRRRQRQADKLYAKKAARKERRASVRQEEGCWLDWLKQEATDGKDN